MLTVLDLCSGIGGFALGLERAGGFRTAAFCEANQFCVEVLQSHWPDVPVFRDLRKLRGWHVGYVDCITAGFPCQPHSLAGKQQGPADPRDLWPDVFRVVREIMPEWFIGENVPGLDGKHMALDRVLADLESAGYSAITIEIPACAVDAPHIRKRLFIVANRNGGGHVADRQRVRCVGQSAAAERHDPHRQAAGWPQGTDGAQYGRKSSHVANRASERPQERQEQRHAQFAAPHRGGHVVNGALVRRTEGRPEHARQQGRSAIAEPSVSSRHMGNGAMPGCAGQRISGVPEHWQAHPDTQWAGAEWLDCPDGKRRRVKPGIRLLAHGVSLRVDSIRAYGNAVCPPIITQIGRAIVSTYD